MENLKSPTKVLLFYFGLVAVAICVFLLVNKWGLEMFPLPSLETVLEDKSHKVNNLISVLLALVTIIIVARLVGGLFKMMKQPAVLGEVLGGILLGPSCFQYFAPDLANYLIPSSVSPFLGIIAQIGIILYMFLVGLELDLKVFKKSGHSTLAVSHMSIVFPFILGTLLALVIYKSTAPAGIGFTSFALFLGVSLSVTAFPVLARILEDKGIQKTRLGNIALACAAIDDVTAWCLLAFVVSIAQATLSSAIVTIVLTVAYVFLMFLVFRPIIFKVVEKIEIAKKMSESDMALIFIAVLLSALVTEAIGIHALFGAFLLGAVTPHDSFLAKDMTHRLQDMIRVLFLPAFFAFTGLRTEIGLVSTGEDWLLCGLIIMLAILGKFGGAFVAARFTGMSWQDSFGLGILMNTRGLVELIVLNIGLDIGVLSPRLFTMLVIMALVTTFMTGPLIQMVLNYQKRSGAV